MISVFWHNRKDYTTGNIVDWHSFCENRLTDSNVLSSFMTDELETRLHIKEKRLHPHISNTHKWCVNRDEPRQTNFNTLHIFRSGFDWNRMNQARIKQKCVCISVGKQASDVWIQLHRDMLSSLERLKKLSSLPPYDRFLHSSNFDVTVHTFLGLRMRVTKSVTIHSIKSAHWCLKVTGVCWQHSVTSLCCREKNRVVQNIRPYNSVENVPHIILK
jgi:hypothetical protein